MRSTPKSTPTPSQPAQPNGKKWVLFRQSYQAYRPNQVVELPERIANQMIGSGMAVPWDRPVNT